MTGFIIGAIVSPIIILLVLNFVGRNKREK